VPGGGPASRCSGDGGRGERFEAGKSPDSLDAMMLGLYGSEVTHAATGRVSFKDVAI